MSSKIFLAIFLSSIILSAQNKSVVEGSDGTVGITHKASFFVNVYLLEPLFANIKTFNPDKDQSMTVSGESFSIDWVKPSGEFIVVSKARLGFTPSKVHTEVVSPKDLKLLLYPSFNTVIVVECYLIEEVFDSERDCRLTIYGREWSARREHGVEIFKILKPTKSYHLTREGLALH